jgi:hypothetical protein
MADNGNRGSFKRREKNRDNLIKKKANLLKNPFDFFGLMLDASGIVVIQWLQACGLLLSYLACSVCAAPMALSQRNSVLDKYVWRCSGPRKHENPRPNPQRPRWEVTYLFIMCYFVLSNFFGSLAANYSILWFSQFCFNKSHLSERKLLVQ